MAIQHYIRDNLRSYIDGKSIPVRSKNGEGLCDLLIRINGADCPMEVKRHKFDRNAKMQLRRSEEHTSELQSLMRISYAVFCLKQTKKTTNRLYHKYTSK